MKKECTRLLIGGGILTLLASPSIFEHLCLQKKTGAPITFSKAELYAEENIIIAPNETPMLKDISEITYYHSLVKQYCEVFALDSESVTQKVIELTNNYSSDEFINNNQIYDFGLEFYSKEQAIVYFLLMLDKNPEKYGLDSSIHVENTYESEELCEDIVKKYCNLFGIDPKICMSIIYTESYYKLNSKNFVERHNPGGAGHTVYDNLEEGIIYQVTNIRYNYYQYGLDIMYDYEFANENRNFFSNAWVKHCPDNDGSWITTNQMYFDNLNEEYYYYAKMRGEYDEKKVLTR